MRLTYKRVRDKEICTNNSYVTQQYMKFYCSWKDKLMLTAHSRKAIRLCQLVLVSKTISFLPVNSLLSKGILHHSQSYEFVVVLFLIWFVLASLAIFFEQSRHSVNTYNWLI